MSRPRVIEEKVRTGGAFRYQGTAGVLATAASVVAALLVLAPSASAQLASSAWPMFMHNLQHTGRTTLVGASAPGVKWTFPTTFEPGTPAVGADGTIYLPAGQTGNGDGTLHAINPNGTQAWAFDLTGGPAATAPAVGSDGTIYVHANGPGNLSSIQTLTAINPNGTEKWTFEFGGGGAVPSSNTQSSPAIASDGSIWVGAADTFLYKLDPADGDVLCDVSPTSSGISSSPAIAGDGTVYVVDATTTLFAFESDCDPKWDYQLSDSFMGTHNPQSPTVATDGKVWVGSQDERLYGINSNGTLHCRFTTGNGIDSTPAIGSDGTVYVGSDGLYAVDPTDCSQDWKFEDALFSSASPAVDANGTIYWRESFTAYAVNPNGTQKWSVSVGAKSMATLDPSAVIGATGTLYWPDGGFSTSTKRLRAYADVTPPAAPTLTDTDPNSPANDNAPEVKGSAEAGSTVRLYSGATCTGTVLDTDSAANFASPGLTPSPALSNNTTTNFRATATDVAGNTSACSAPFTYVEDSSPPAPPSITDTDPNSPANDNAPEVKGSAEAGSTVRLYSDATCTGTVLDTDSAANFASPGLTPSPALSDNTTTSFRATATDAAGNPSGCSGPFAYVEDSTIPEAPTITDTDPNSPSKTATQPFVKGSADAGTVTVEVFTQANCGGSAISGTKAAFVGAGIQVTVPANQTTPLSALARNGANTASACSALSFPYTHDNLAPAAPAITDTDPNSPANDNAPEVKGSAEAGSTVRLYSDATCTGTVLDTDGAANFASPGLTPSPALSNNTTTNFRATATDAAGNTSVCSAPLAYVEDSAAPAAPAITDSDPNSPGRDSSPQLKGSAEAGATVRLYGSPSCGGALEEMGTAAVFGSPGLPAAVTSNATATFTATATDAAGNLSGCSSTFSYRHDSIAPDTTITGGPPARTRRRRAKLLFSSSEPGSSFRCRLDGGVFAPCSSPKAYRGLARRRHTFRVQAVDAAGNVDASPASRSWKVKRRRRR